MANEERAIVPPYPADRLMAPVHAARSGAIPIADDGRRSAGIPAPASQPGPRRYPAFERPPMDRGALYVALCLFLWSLMLLGTGFGIGLLVGS